MTIISNNDLERKRREKEEEKKRRQRFPWDSGTAIRLEDFYAYMPLHKYIYVPTRDLWPAASVDARLPPVLANPNAKDTSEEMYVPASKWLDHHRPVEQLTWMPGAATIIEDAIVAEGGFIRRPGSRIFNLYQPPQIEPGDPNKAGPWLEHVRTIYPNGADHILKWLAHRVQRPGEKINHALLLGGAPGIGKDSLLVPVVYAIGAWNCEEVNPVQLLGRFNGFIKSVILRINEARDLGDISTYSFYEHLKPITAAPPETLRIDEKGLREYRVPNVCGVIITSNYKSDGCYLPADDRRHYVAWSELPAAGEEGALSSDYFDQLYRWYHEEGGLRHVAAWLKEHDLDGFDPKAPPRKTHAFWEIVDAHRGSDESEFADAIDKMTDMAGGRNPVVFSTDKLIRNASDSLAAWIRETKNRRQVPKRLEKVGYIRVQNPDAEDHLWKINRRRQAVYGLQSVSEKERIDAARNLLRTES